MNDPKLGLSISSLLLKSLARMTENTPIQKIIRNGLIAAGLMNIGGALLFSKFFTNTVINEADPVVMSNFGLLMIIVWGLAYIGASFVQSGIRWLAACGGVRNRETGLWRRLDKVADC
jgi:hypothetical protein